MNQNADDALARQVVDEVSSGCQPKRKYALYLRSFIIDTSISHTRYSGNIFDLDQAYRPGKQTLERLLGGALRGTYVTVALGMSSDGVFGVGQAGIFSDWQIKVEALIKYASLIFINPSLNSGILWEVRNVVNNVEMERVVFIMPWFPHDIGDSYFPDVNSSDKHSAEAYALEWNKLGKEYKERFALDMPTYNKEGAMFRYKGAEKKLVYQSLNGDKNPRSFARKINAVLG